APTAPGGIRERSLRGGGALPTAARGDGGFADRRDRAGACDGDRGGRVTERACENCAFPDEELVLVRRIYVTPETWDTPASQQIGDQTELWCVSCRSQSPHEVVEDDDS